MGSGAIRWVDFNSYLMPVNPDHFGLDASRGARAHTMPVPDFNASNHRDDLWLFDLP